VPRRSNSAITSALTEVLKTIMEQAASQGSASKTPVASGLFPKKMQATGHRERSYDREKRIANDGFNSFKEALDHMSHQKCLTKPLRRVRRAETTA
jgi:hypothetical protein